MLANSDFPIDEALRFFTSRNLEVGFVVPTDTGLRKSIMDAHGSLRAFLRGGALHDFELQPKGPGNKVMIDAVVLSAFDAKSTRVSFYRPETKGGDPRLWIYGLGNWAKPGNLIALFVVDDTLYLANLSDTQVWEARNDPDSPLGDVLRSFVSEEDRIAQELVDKLTAIASKGWVQTMRPGDTGVGYTLETLLGIKANSNRAPDYRGIELKSGRGAGGRTTLFSQVPDWRSSSISSAKELLATYGYLNEHGRLQLYCTNHARPNPLGLFMRADDASVHCLAVRDTTTEHVVRWSLPELEAALAAKHASTFWIKAAVDRDVNGREYFHYRSVVHTRGPLVANLGPAINTSKVTLDFTLSTLESGRARDHGYLFRTTELHQAVLFPPPARYTLSGPLPKSF